jgi:hypothetical protein
VPEAGVAIGSGPVHAIMGFPGNAPPPDPRGLVHVRRRGARSPLLQGGVKVLWAIEPTYEDPALVRGRRIDGPGKLRFRAQPGPWRQTLRLPGAGGASWGYGPSAVRITHTGCYAMQVDTIGGRERLVFRAVA